MIVLDANILIRAVLGKRVHQLLEEYSQHGVRFFAPDVAFDDAQEYIPSLLGQRGISDVSVPRALKDLQRLVEPVDQESYSLFENQARQRLKGRDEEDWPVLASAMLLACAIWTEDRDFFGTGIAVWTTNRIEIYLKSQALPASTKDE